MVQLVVGVAAGGVASMVMVVLLLKSLLALYFDICSVRKWVGKFAPWATPILTRPPLRAREWTTRCSGSEIPITRRVGRCRF